MQEDSDRVGVLDRCKQVEEIRRIQEDSDRIGVRLSYATITQVGLSLTGHIKILLYQVIENSKIMDNIQICIKLFKCMTFVYFRLFYNLKLLILVCSLK